MQGSKNNSEMFAKLHVQFNEKIVEIFPRKDKNVMIEFTKEEMFLNLLVFCLMTILVHNEERRFSTNRIFRLAVSLRKDFYPKEFCECIGILKNIKLPREQMILDLIQTEFQLKPAEPQADVCKDEVFFIKLPFSLSPPIPSNLASACTKLLEKEITPALFLSHDTVYTTNNIDLFLTTLTLMALIDRHTPEKSIPLAESVVQQLSQFKTAATYDDVILAKAIFYVCRVYELTNQFPSLIKFLMTVHRTALFHQYKLSQAVALNSILRIYLQQSDYEQATKFLKKTTYPESLHSNAQHCRYLYYLSRNLAVQLEYADAYSKVTQAIRKSFQGTGLCRGFRLATNKLSIILQLLMGDIPERRLFNQKDLAKQLQPYGQIVQAVRSGDLTSFQRVIELHKKVFEEDSNLFLVQRLYENVIRAGLRKISASYCCISFADIGAKLGLDPTDDLECIISKAIADGIIDATINSETQTVHTKLNTESLNSREIRKALSTKIDYCVQLHNNAVKAMRYTNTQRQLRVEEAFARRKEHLEQLARTAKDEMDAGEDSDLI